jgi:Uma2 family endonuclease
MAIETPLEQQVLIFPAIPCEPIWRLSVAQYHQMTRQGILTDDDPVELLEGWLVTKMPKNPPHRLATQLAREALATMLPVGWHINDQEPITTEESEPEPDLSIVRGERRHYVERHPSASDLALVIEVADTTLQRDRTSKQRIYARAAIPVYWIINLAERQVEVYTNPSGTGVRVAYQQRHDYGATDRVPVLLAGGEIGAIGVDDLLP